jgi:hypothetical protein
MIYRADDYIAKPFDNNELRANHNQRKNDHDPKTIFTRRMLLMSDNSVLNNDRKMTSIFERFLSLWVVLCIFVGILLGKIAPGLAQYLDGPGHLCQGRAGSVHTHRHLPVFHDVSHHGQD